MVEGHLGCAQARAPGVQGEEAVVSFLLCQWA